VYSIVKDIPRPADLPGKSPGSKYPLAEMDVGESFIVPYEEMKAEETPEKFRNRIYQSARNYALRDLDSQKKVSPDGEHVKKEFTAALMRADDDSEAKRWATGDVVVWRDK
jgi:hypothetical protein